MASSLRMKSLLNTATMLVAVSIGVRNVDAGTSFHDLQLTNGQVSPDGIVRDGILVNGNLLTTPIIGQKGDEFHITIDNQLTSSDTHKSTSIHWHGLFQRGSSWADGPAFVTQCPIAPGNNFTYVFTATDEAGSFWYHSHLDAQYCDGLRGPFVLYDEYDPHIGLYDVDNKNTIITLADWYANPTQKITGDPEPRSTLINGLGRTVNTTTAPLAVITVTQGLKYRFRLISMSCAPNYIFSIENHEMTIIEADGNSVDPVTVTSLQIYAAQRYSFVLDANQAVDNYWIRANPNRPPTGFADNINSAILRYEGADEVEPTGQGLQDDDNRLNEVELHATVDPGAPGAASSDGADVDIVINIGFVNDTGRFTIDGTSFMPPNVPALLQILSGASSVDDLLPSGSYIGLPANKTVQIALPVLAGFGSALGGPHPFHLHGHAFDVVRSSGSSVYNYVNPVRRDVVAIGTPGDNVTIRFRTDNAGPWLLHCHILWHLRAGLAVVLAERISEIPSGPAPSPEWDQLCDIYNALPLEDQ